MLDKPRIGEISYALLKRKFRKEGVRLNPDFRREVGNLAKELGFPKEELMEFSELVVREMVEEMFAKDNDPESFRPCP